MLIKARLLIGAAQASPSDPRSTVNPVNVANTCARCHADANYMKGYSIPTDQFAKYSTSG